MDIPQQKFVLKTGSGNEIEGFEFEELDYLKTQSEMQEFAAHRGEKTPDQIWVLEHPPVYTQGTACSQNTLMPSDIPIVKSDRGGQITYHGPGQIVMYPMLRLKDYGMGVKALVNSLEQTVIDLLKDFEIVGTRRADAPGIYVADEKIAALGLRIRKGTSYHGLSLNVDMDMQPFKNIDPCGYQGLQVTQLVDHCLDVDKKKIGLDLVTRFASLI